MAEPLAGHNDPQDIDSRYGELFVHQEVLSFLPRQHLDQLLHLEKASCLHGPSKSDLLLDHALVSRLAEAKGLHVLERKPPLLGPVVAVSEDETLESSCGQTGHREGPCWSGRCQTGGGGSPGCSLARSTPPSTDRIDT